MRSALALLLLAAAAAPEADSRIRPEALRAHMRFLADDQLEGREAGTRGYDVAAAYVAAQLEAYGVEPAGAAGGYLQPVPLRTAILDVPRCRLRVTRAGVAKDLALKQDYVPSPDLLRETSLARGPVVFVGFGISAPRRGLDDYAGVDVKGKLVLIASGAPASLPSEERAYYSGLRVKRENAARHGAIGLLVFVLPPDEAAHPWSRVVEHIEDGSSAWLREDGSPEGASEAILGSASLSRAGVEALTAGSPHGFDEIAAAAEAGRPLAFELGASVELAVASQPFRRFSSANVLGLLRGSDAKLAAEAVVLSAHLDHIGIGAPVDGDAIRNGAYDNASGVADLLETARALSGLPRPRRSVLFAAVTAEEKGLLGSDYLAAHPPLRLVADVNMDMSLALFPAKDVVAFGSEHSSLGAVVAEAAAGAGLVLSPDPMPRQTIFIRSDQYSFVRRGVPAVMLMAGVNSRDPKIDGAARFAEWLATVYHSPKDDMSQPIDFAAAARIAEVNLRIARRLADAPEPPAWKPGDLFGELFGGATR